jgi:hypothetical protein
MLKIKYPSIGYLGTKFLRETWFLCFMEEGRRKREEGRRKKEEGRRKRKEGGRKKEEDGERFLSSDRW